MAVLTLPKLKSIKLTKLQALLLLGGAFVLAAIFWTASRYRLVKDETGLVPAQAVVALEFIGKTGGFQADALTQKMIAALPQDAKNALSQADSTENATLFAATDDQGQLQWGLLEALNSPPIGKSVWRFMPKEVGAFGFVSVAARKQPMTVIFGSDHSFFRIGHAYSGILADTPALKDERKMVASLNQELLYVEKPEGSSWAGIAAPIASEMKSFQDLSSFWTLPGRVELSVSASHTETAFQPFSLYYHQFGNADLPKTLLESYTKNLLAEAFPHQIDIQLPDGSHMQELRHDTGGVQIETRQNQFGDIEKFSYPDEKEALYAFYTKEGEAWLTTDLPLVQAILVGNINSTTPDGACDKGGQGGFALFPGSFMPFSNGFRSFSVSIHNLETGLFTMCGYY